MDELNMLSDEEKNLIKQRQLFDQGMEEMINIMPRLWWRMYCRLQEEGFDKDRAMALLMHYMQITHRI